MAERARNDLTIYDAVADDWWSDEIRWVRTLKNLVPGRLAWFDRKIDWSGKDVLDLGCAGGFMAEALVEKGARVTGIDPAAQAQDASAHGDGDGRPSDHSQLDPKDWGVHASVQSTWREKQPCPARPL